MPACTQCRQRKVRCSGQTDDCEACQRLGFNCSFSSGTNSPSGASSSSATVVRKRGPRACDGCRSQRIRCVQEQNRPECVRCLQKSIRCVFSLSVRRYRRDARERTQEIGAGIMKPPGSLATGLGSSFTAASPIECTPSSRQISQVQFDTLLGCDRSIAMELLEAYFEYVYPVLSFGFLNRAETLSRYARNQLSQALLLAICGTASRFVASSVGHEAQARDWASQAEHLVLRNLGTASLDLIQAIMVLGFNYRCNHHSSKTFFLLPLAIRMAVFLNMHKEDDTLDVVTQESRRRLIWCMFTVDRFAAGGIAEYVLLPTSILSIQLPCQDFDFETHRPTVSPQIYDLGRSSADISMCALAIRLFDTRNRILQYTKYLLMSSASPDQSLDRFKTFEQELRTITLSIPVHLQFSDRACYSRASSPERTTFIAFHVYVHHCHCELYRLLNPGYREALPTGVVEKTSVDLVGYAQGKCLKHAVLIGDIVRTSWPMIKADLYVSDPGIFVLLYQASCAILYACHRDSPAFSMSPHLACGYLEVFVAALSKLLAYFPRFKVYVDDIKNMLKSIQHPNMPMPRQVAAADVDFRARTLAEKEQASDEEHDVRIAAISRSRIEASHETNLPELDGTASCISQCIALQQDGPLDTHQDSQPWPYFGPCGSSLTETEHSADGLLWNWAEVLDIDLTALDA